MSRVQLQRVMLLLTVTLGVLLFPIGKVSPGVWGMYLDDAFADAPVIVLAKVTAVDRQQNGFLKATARVVEVFKGPNRDTVSYWAGGRDDVPPGDSSTARLGELVLLLLVPEHGGQADVFRIAHFGAGRLPVHTIKGSQFAESGALFLRPNIPQSTTTVGEANRKLILLDWLRALAKRGHAETPHE